MQEYSYFDVVILGIIEGLTEFIPVSSTGHLILVSKYLSFEGKVADTFSIFIQLGAILAVCVIFKDRFLALLKKQTTSSNFSGLKGISLLVVGSIPACVAGLLFHSKIKELLFSPLTVALALCVGGVVMILIERFPIKEKIGDVDDITYREALAVGLFQCFALWPGMSRSASTIIGGMLFGLKRKVAAEFSFLLAVPIMCAAVGYDLLKSLKYLDSSSIGIFALGFIVSFITGLFAIKFFLKLLENLTLAPFGLSLIHI